MHAALVAREEGACSFAARLQAYAIPQQSVRRAVRMPYQPCCAARRWPATGMYPLSTWYAHYAAVA